MTGREEKQRRMALRRKNGTRNAPAGQVRSLGADYLIAHACFACRKSFKRAPLDDAKAICPQCGGQLHEMGRSFKAPKNNDNEQWLKVQALYAYGFRFFSYRSYPHAPKLPERLREVEEFVAENPRHQFRVAAINKALQPTRQKPGGRA